MKTAPLTELCAKTSTSNQLQLPLRALCALTLLATPFGLYADINPGGSLSNFEVYNDSGKPSHGFEIQVDNGAQSDLYYTGFSERYGAGKIAPFTTPAGSGINIRWESLKDSSGHYSNTTPIHDLSSTNYSWQDCYLGGAGYATSGCEIYGQGLRYPYNPNLSAKGYFLVDDASHPGNLIRDVTPVAIPTMPSYTVSQTTVTVSVEAPEPAETPETYGDAQWMKIYKKELARPAKAIDLNTSKGIVPTTAADLELDWDILQVEPASNGNQKRKGASSGINNPTTRAIIRRIETYKYTGAYDAVTHKALCADLTCTAPSAGELGAFQGANNSAINVNPDALVVTKAGKGTVTDTTNTIRCGSSCSAFTSKNGILNLTASPSTGNVFVGWTGACIGTLPTCGVTVKGVTKVRAVFKSLFTLSVAIGNKGTVTGVPAGTDNSINCGSVCRATFKQGTVVTLTATPPTGKTFVGWSGGCTGVAPVCSTTINANTSVKADFSK